MDEHFFLKRPSGKERNKTLAKLQEEFLKGKCQPSVQLVKQQRAQSSSSQGSNAASCESNPSSSTSFKSSDKSAVPVLFDVMEKDVVDIPISLPKSHVIDLPLRQGKDLAYKMKKNKKSIFLQQMEDLEKQKEQNNCSTFCDTSSKNEADAGSFIIDGSGLSVEERKYKAEEIHKENLNKLSKMDPKDIIEQQQFYLEKLSPDVVQFIRSRRKNKVHGDSDSTVQKKASVISFASSLNSHNQNYHSISENLSGDANETVLQKSDSCDYDALLLERLDDLNVDGFQKGEAEKGIGKNSSSEISLENSENTNQRKIEINEEDLPLDLKEAKKFLHMDKIEWDKLAWMSSLPKPKLIDLKTGHTARFGFKGQLLLPDEDISTKDGLHHHSNEPELAGYSIEELFTLSRSSNRSQKDMSLKILAYILENYWEGRMDGCFSSPLLSTLLDAGMAPLLRYTLDDPALLETATAFRAVHCLLICKSDEDFLDLTFYWPNGHLSPFFNAEDVEPNINLEELTDANICKVDVIKGFLRMDILSRFRYILRNMISSMEICQLVLEICIRITRHSYNSATKVAEFPGLLDIIFEKFLPLTWNYKRQDISSPDYYCPMYSALKLIRVLASASSDLAAILAKDYHLTESLKCYLAIDPSDDKLPPADAQKLIIESLRTWRVFLGYDFCVEIYSEMFPLLIRHFQFCQSLSLDENVGHVQNYIYAAHLIKAFEGIVEHVLKPPKLTSRSPETPASMLEWKDISVLLNMTTACLKRWLDEFCHSNSNYAGRSLLATCLNFLASFCSLAPVNSVCKNDVLNSAKEIVNDYLMPCLQSRNFSEMLLPLSSCSVLLYDGKSGRKRDIKVLTSLGCVCWRDDVIPLLKKETPFPLLSSVAHLFCAMHDLQNDKMPLILQALLTHSSVLDYLEKFTSSSSLLFHWFDRFEIECIYRILNLFFITEEKQDFCYKIAVSLITCFRSPYEHYLERIMKNILFNPKIFCNEIANENLKKLDDIRNFYHCYFLKSENDENYGWYKLKRAISFESSGPHLLEKGWPLDPVFRYYECSKSRKQNELSPSEMLYGTTCCLLWANLSAKLKYSAISQISMSVKFCSLYLVFLMDEDLFKNKGIQQLLKVCLQGLLINKQHIPLESFRWKSIPDFDQIYSELLEQYESISFGDHVFAAFVVFPLQQCYPCRWKTLLLTEHSTAVRFLSVPLSELPVPLENYLEPLEKNEDVLMGYFKALKLGILNRTSSPLLFLMAVHHLHHFLISDDKSSCSLTLRTSLKKNSNLEKIIYEYSDYRNT